MDIYEHPASSDVSQTGTSYFGGTNANSVWGGQQTFGSTARARRNEVLDAASTDTSRNVKNMALHTLRGKVPPDTRNFNTAQSMSTYDKRHGGLDSVKGGQGMFSRAFENSVFSPADNTSVVGSTAEVRTART